MAFEESLKAGVQLWEFINTALWKLGEAGELLIAANMESSTKIPN
jgi:hypothetical protein